MICTQCGKKVRDDALFCDKCGEKINHCNSQYKYCGNCGTKMNINEIFCGNCGQKSTVESKEEYRNYAGSRSTMTSNKHSDIFTKTVYSVIILLIVVSVAFTVYYIRNKKHNASELIENTKIDTESNIPETFSNSNKYNEMGYINISGRTLEDIAGDVGMSVDEFKAEYRLPEDMTGDTYESAAFYNMPTGKIAEMYGMEFSGVAELLKLPDTVTETTPWGEAEGEAMLKNYVGEDAVDAFKKEYGLGDNITGDTKWKYIRNTVDQKTLEQRLEKESENSQTDNNGIDNKSNLFKRQ
ncbi:MAG: zinc ribbon domain-containing protein [Oscillospiraceae bacterium]|nr:zinc ribbon domain-containing protein [Oscillospiraceae bacterium]